MESKEGSTQYELGDRSPYVSHCGPWDCFTQLFQEHVLEGEPSPAGLKDILISSGSLAGRKKEARGKIRATYPALAC